MIRLVCVGEPMGAQTGSVFSFQIQVKPATCPENIGGGLLWFQCLCNMMVQETHGGGVSEESVPVASVLQPEPAQSPTLSYTSLQL